MPSEVIGTLGLWVAVAAAIVVAASQTRDAGRLRAAVGSALVVLLVQAAHVIEEFTTGFHRLFPEPLGLAPWSDAFFLSFNVVWLAVWSTAVVAAQSGRFALIAGALLWFLAIAAVVNGIAHPALAVLAGGYFPGLISAPFLGVAGLFLMRRLATTVR